MVPLFSSVPLLMFSVVRFDAAVDVPPSTLLPLLSSTFTVPPGLDVQGPDDVAGCIVL